jgi:hypothetical protein
MGLRLGIVFVKRSLQIHQLFHGYRRGHEQLSASTKLDRPDSDLVTRLSDLSGTLLSGISFTSYLTIYPLPSSQFYAVAMTLPDPTVPRAGCVFTHTLLLDMNDWATLPVPKDIISLFVDSTAVPDKPVSVLNYTPPHISANDQSGTISPEDVDFIARYFGEGIRPIIWIDAPSANDKLWAIVAGLWPSLRRSFSACTLCLQPRTLETRMFDLMFAPRVASPRFSRLSKDHFIGSPELTKEPWQHEFATQLFGGLCTSPHRDVFHDSLNDDPTSIRKLFLFQELWERSKDKPSAAIGAFDLLESNNSPEATLQLQSVALNRALSSLVLLPSIECLELFSMLLIRIARIRADGYRDDTFLKCLFDDVFKDVITEFPDSVLSDIEKIWPTLGNDAPLRSAVISNVAETLPESTALILAIAGHPDLGKSIIIEFPAAFAKAVRRSEAKVLRDQALVWLNESSIREKLPIFRAQLIGNLQPTEDYTLFKSLLTTDIGEEEVWPILDAAIGGKGLQSHSSTTVELLIDLIVQRFPKLSAKWIESSKFYNESTAEMLASTYSADVSAYPKRAISADPNRKFSRWVLSYWIVRNAAHSQKFVREVCAWAERDSEILELLIGPECGAVVDRALQIIVENISSIPTESILLLEDIFSFKSRNEKLIDLAIRSAISDYVQSSLNLSALDKVSSQNVFIEWLGAGQTWRLTSAIGSAISGMDSCSRGWEVIHKMVDAVGARQVVVSTIESLLGSTARFCSSTAIQIWVKVIQKTRGSAGFELDLCGQAVRFAFENPHLPASPLLVEAFSTLYKSVTDQGCIPSTAASLFSSWYWDKGSELREGLVHAFLAGSWPPGDLALAVGDIGLLRKILKRMSRKYGGSAFARKIYSDLVSRTDNSASAMAKSLSELLKNPDYYEDWD